MQLTNLLALALTVGIAALPAAKTTRRSRPAVTAIRPGGPRLA